MRNVRPVLNMDEARLREDVSATMPNFSTAGEKIANTVSTGLAGWPIRFWL